MARKPPTKRKTTAEKKPGQKRRKPYKLDHRKAIIAAARAGVPRSMLGPAGKVTRETCAQWIADDPEFSLAIEMAYATRLKKIIKRADELIRKGDASLVRTFLRPLASEFRFEGLPGQSGHAAFGLEGAAAAAAAGAAAGVSVFTSLTEEMVEQIQQSERDARAWKQEDRGDAAA